MKTNFRNSAILFLILSFSLLLFLFKSNATALDQFPFVVIGDMGCDCDGQQEVALKMLEWYKDHPYQTVLTVGDNIYGTTFGFLKGSMGGNQNLFALRFDKHYKVLLDQGIKFYATLGNHDVITNKGRDEIDDKVRFNILSDEGYYSFSPLGLESLVTFFALDSNTLTPKNPELKQIDWLKKSLAASKSIWKIAYFHHPLYTPDSLHAADRSFRNLLEPIFVQGGIQIGFSGHNHFYARMKLQKGVTYFITGGGGNKLNSPIINSQTEVAVRSFQFMYLELHSDRAEFWSIPPTGKFLDHGTILPQRVK